MPWLPLHVVAKEVETWNAPGFHVLTSVVYFVSVLVLTKKQIIVKVYLYFEKLSLRYFKK